MNVMLKIGIAGFVGLSLTACAGGATLAATESGTEGGTPGGESEGGTPGGETEGGTPGGTEEATTGEWTPPEGMEPFAGGVERHAPDAPDADVEALVAGNNSFAVAFNSVAGTANLVTSPYSLSIAFAMLSAGTRGATLDEIEAGLEFGLDQSKLHPAFNRLDQELASRAAGGDVNGGGSYFSLSIANALFFPLGDELEAAFVDTITGYYGAGLFSIDSGTIGGEGAAAAANSWFEDQTDGQIPEVLKPFHFAAWKFIVANAISFEASWAAPFEEEDTQDAPFHRPDGSTVQVPTMHGYSATGDYRYAEGDGWVAVGLPYYGGHFELLMVMPDEDRFEEVEANLDPAEVLGQLKGWIAVTLAMPRFSIESTVDMRPALAALGLNSMWILGTDFEPMVGGTTAVTAVIHRAKIDVDERGTKASAATAIVGGGDGGPSESVSVALDRPFVFAVMDLTTKSVLFAGRVTDPGL